jgi:hypothetical protein
MPTCDVNDLTFGCEFETTIPVGTIIVGGYHNGRTIAGLPEGWKAEHDCSIRATAGFTACEVVSPILKGADGLKQVKQICDYLNSIGAKVNSSTGFHVHIGWIGDADALKRLTSYVSNYEQALFASTGTRTRETGQFCQPIRTANAYTGRFRDGQTERLPSNRYHVLNVTNLQPGRHGTVEFRVFAGTTNVTKAIGYIRLCLGLVEKAIIASRVPKWVGKTPVATSPLHRKGGEGQTELVRLMYALGWTKGDTSHVFGDVQAEGLPTHEDAKKELMRLAAKYDSRVEDVEPAPAAPLPGWTNWSDATWDQWERSLRRGQSVRVFLPDGTFCPATFVRRFPRNMRIQVSHLTPPIMVPRIGNVMRSNINRLIPCRN